MYGTYTYVVNTENGFRKIRISNTCGGTGNKIRKLFETRKTYVCVRVYTLMKIFRYNFSQNAY